MLRLGARILGLLLLSAGVASAQTSPEGGAAGGQRFFIEWAGGTVGSAAGFGLGFLVTETTDCHSEDLECTLRDAGIALAGSALGSGVGTWLTGRGTSTEPSLLGASLGALIGIPAGIAVVHTLSEELEWVRNDPALFVSYAVTQGLFSAIGSRLVARLRD